MKKTLAELFSSKKFIVAVAAVVAYVISRAGFDVSQDEAEKVLLFVGVLIGAQGAADFGKAAALATAQTAPPPSPGTTANTQAQPAKPPTPAASPGS